MLDDSSDPAKGAAAATKVAADPRRRGRRPVQLGRGADAADAREGGLALVSPSNTLTSLTLGPDSAKPVRPYQNYFRLVGADSAQAVSSSPSRPRKLGYTRPRS